MFAERWLKDRERRKIRDVTNDRGRLTKHVLPVLGDNPIADLRPRHMRDLVRTWRANEDMAPRTLRKRRNPNAAPLGPAVAPGTGLGSSSK
jgi:hypothetical protein